MRTVPIGSAKVKSSTLFNPNGRKKPRKYNRTEQMLLDANSVKGVRKVKVTGIHSEDMGATYVGEVGSIRVKRINYVNGTRDKQGRTVGLWQRVA